MEHFKKSGVQYPTIINLPSSPDPTDCCSSLNTLAAKPRPNVTPREDPFFCICREVAPETIELSP